MQSNISTHDLLLTAGDFFHNKSSAMGLAIATYSTSEDDTSDIGEPMFRLNDDTTAATASRCLA